MNIEKPKLLLVEDDPQQRRRYKRDLEDGYEVTEAESEQDAMKRLDQARFDVIVCDMRMQARDAGLITARALWSVQYSGLNTVFIIYTAHPNLPDCVAAIKAGAYDYLSKNEIGAVDTLLKSCRAGLEEKREWAESPDAEFVQKNWGKLLEEHGEKWIAVRGREVIASDEGLRSLNQQLRERFPHAKPYIVRLESAEGLHI